MAQIMAKSPPAIQEIWVQFLSQEDPLEKEMATHSSILVWRIPWTVHGVTKSWTQLNHQHFLSLYHFSRFYTYALIYLFFSFSLTPLCLTVSGSIHVSANECV